MDALRKHIEAKIKEAPLERSPFPHLIIQNFFPEETFDRILSYNPFKQNRGVEWLSTKRSKEVSSHTPYYARKQINFHVGQPFDAAPEERAFWDELTQCFLGDDWFTRVVYEKFPDFFNLRFGDLIDEPNFWGMLNRELFLQRHEPGYYIGPHTDIPTRVFTCIFAFADRPGFEEYGTELLSPKNPMDRCWGSDHYPPEGFDVKKVAPYAPNNFLLFFKTRQSFHAVRAIDETVPNQRYGMQFQLYEPVGGLFNDLSTPDLMHVRRPAHLQAKPNILAKAAKRILAKAG
jgi:hypothetical protein